jgi:hypothetical protein
MSYRAPRITLAFIGKLMDAISQKAVPHESGHGHVINVLGLTFHLENRWFASAGDLKRIMLKGRDWSVTVEFSKDTLRTGYSLNGGAFMTLPGHGRVQITSYEISNEDAVLRDLTILRTAGGFDQLFAGNILKV